MTKRTMRDIGEHGLLESLTALLQRQTRDLPLGSGDDVAITHPPPADERLVWTIDTMVEGTHFRWWDHPAATPAALAERLVACNVSDLASKGARPLAALLSLGVPPDTSVERVNAFFEGLEKAVASSHFSLVGGDTVRAPQWVLSLALVGVLEHDAPIAARREARPGWNVFVSGSPGEAAAGLDILEGRLPADSPAADRLVERCLRPRARLALGRSLVAMVSDLAMIDVSDGVASDANQIARASGTSLVLDSAALPLSRDLREVTNDPDTALRYFLHGGEDFELLFCTPASEQQIRSATDIITDPVPVTLIGRVEVGKGVWMRDLEGKRLPIALTGFQHFS